MRGKGQAEEAQSNQDNQDDWEAKCVKMSRGLKIKKKANNNNDRNNKTGENEKGIII